MLWSPALEDALMGLENVGRTTVQWLHAIGVRDRERLAELGAAEAFRRVRDRGFRANLVLLYALEGALRDTAWRDLDDSTKADLRKAVGVH